MPFSPAHSASTPTRQDHLYRPELDALRFFAFLCVFLTHGVGVNLKSGILAHHQAIGRAIDFLYRAGGYGLPLFFFLSSFLITTLLLVEKGKTGHVHLRNFYIRRMLRIWPLYFGFLALAFLLGLIWPPGHFNIRPLLAFLLLSGNWYVIATTALPGTMRFLWSISVEEQFYLLWPAITRKLSAHGIRRFCMALTVLSLCSIGLLAATHSVVINIWFNSATQMLFFAVGGLFALQIGLIRQKKSAWKALAALLFGTVAWVAADAMVGSRMITDTIPPLAAVMSYVFACSGCAAFLWAFLHMPTSWLGARLVYLGRISYGLYVFQGIGLVLGRRWLEPHMKGGTWLIVSLAFTVMCAIPCYEFFEKPFLRLKRRFELVHPRPS